jgi:hypothetical protein
MFGSKRFKAAIAILGVFVLFAAIMVTAFRESERSEHRLNSNRVTLHGIEGLIQSYYADFGTLPPHDHIVESLLGDNERVIRYIDKDRARFPNDQILDSLKNPIIIEYEGDKVSLRSAGLNGVYGDEDDITHSFEVGQR